MSNGFLGFIVTTVVCVFFTALLGASLWGCPRYSVWQQGLAGEAALRRAEWDRQTQVVEARAKEEAAKALAKAEVLRARGAAKANHIIGSSLRDNEAYLRYLWIDHIDKVGDQIIYVPTEAGLPILEAGRSRRRPLIAEAVK